MHFLRTCAAFTLASAVLPAAFGQTGALDQVSPAPSFNSFPHYYGWFNGDEPWLIWQAQVRAGIAGQLEGFKLHLAGPSGAQLIVRLRAGDGWNTTPVLFRTRLTKATSSNETVFVDATSAGLQLAVDSTFVIELQGNGTGCGILGSLAPPNLGPPLYPEPLFLNGPGCWAGCFHRIGFLTYVLTGGTAKTYCTPKVNSAGCTPGISFAGTPNATSGSGFQISAANILPNTFGLLFYGKSGPSAAPFQGGILCANPPLVQTMPQNSGGAAPCSGSFAMDFNAYIASGADPALVSGQQVNAQYWSRDTGFAPGKTNLTDAVEFTIP
jgi:hypothetical protein